MVFQSSCSHGAQGRKLLRAGHFPQETFRTNPQTAHSNAGFPGRDDIGSRGTRHGPRKKQAGGCRSLGKPSFAAWGLLAPTDLPPAALPSPQSPNAAAAAMALPGVASSQSPSPGDLKSLPVLKLRAAVLCCEDLRCLMHKTQRRGSTLRPPPMPARAAAAPGAARRDRSRGAAFGGHSPLTRQAQGSGTLRALF